MFVLIMVIMVKAVPTATTAEFNNLSACRAAGEAVAQQFGGRNFVSYACYPKG